MKYTIETRIIDGVKTAVKVYEAANSETMERVSVIRRYGNRWNYNPKIHIHDMYRRLEWRSTAAKMPEYVDVVDYINFILEKGVIYE